MSTAPWVEKLTGLFSPRAETTPPVPFTQPGDNNRWFGNAAGERAPNTRTLDMTTVESTLFSVLDLISADVAAVDWGLYRTDQRMRAARPDTARPPLTADQHLAVRLWDKPNDFYTGEHLRTVVQWHHDAVGEGWMVCQYFMPGVPESFWWVRPDRMRPVTDTAKYLVGYVYTGPSGETIPLELDEVLRITRPHPLDPHRGIGPVQTLMQTLSTSLTAQQWIEAFYRNDATPGGMIELGLDQPLQLDDYRKMVSRWNDQHRGVRRAHRVGILEMGQYKPTVVDFKKLQVTEMRQLTRDQILEAFRVNKNQLGATDDVNRAAALAADDTYAKRTVKPRVRKWASFANGPYLACFGDTGRGLQWVPENVVPEDEEAENAERVSKASAFKTYVDAGMEYDDAAMLCDLPAGLRMRDRTGATA